MRAVSVDKVLKRRVAMENGPTSATSGSNGAAAAMARQREPVQADSEPEDRVAELRRRYLEGTYKVDAAQLSARIVDKHLDP
jgi:anti-sigma28 factor (negative regulator of flagellin synthesis)